jgi:hypothetical protein
MFDVVLCLKQVLLGRFYEFVPQSAYYTVRIYKNLIFKVGYILPPSSR